MRIQREELLARIDAAFGGAEAYRYAMNDDNEWASQESHETSKYLDGKRWTDIDFHAYPWPADALHWVPPRAASLILPAYLREIVQNAGQDFDDPEGVLDSVLECLIACLTPNATQWSPNNYSNDYWSRSPEARIRHFEQGYANMSLEEKQVVADTLCFLIALESGDGQQIAYSIDMYWRTYVTFEVPREQGPLVGEWQGLQVMFLGGPSDVTIRYNADGSCSLTIGSGDLNMLSLELHGTYTYDEPCNSLTMTLRYVPAGEEDPEIAEQAAVWVGDVPVTWTGDDDISIETPWGDISLSRRRESAT